MRKSIIGKILSVVLRVSCVVLVFASCGTPIGEHHDEWKKYFDEYHVTGCFDFYDVQTQKFTDYNEDRCHQRFIPASTFKIFNSLVALQTETVPNEHYIIPWDSVVRAVPEWNHSQDMAEAFRNSTVWYYQALARKIGDSTYQKFLKAAHYGNMQTSGSSIDSFWLTGNLRISSDEQIEFLKDLCTYQLPFSNNYIDAVKHMMLRDSTGGYKLYYKTGWGMMKEQGDSAQLLNIGWMIGFIEKEKNTYLFVTNIQSANPAPENFGEARNEITMHILNDMGLIKN